MTGVLARTRSRLERLFDEALDAQAVALRQMMFTLAFLISFAATAPVVGQISAPMWFSLVIVVAVQAAAAFVPWPSLHSQWQSILPLAQMVALLLFDAGTGPVATFLPALVFLPVMSLSTQQGLAGVALASVVAFATFEAITLSARDFRWDTFVARSVVVPLTALLFGLGVHGVMAQLQARTDALEQLQQDQERALEEIRDSHESLTLVSERLRATRDSLSGVINAASLHAIIGVDDNGTIFLFSKGAENLLGYPGSAALGMEMTSFYDEDELRAAADERGLDWDEDAARSVITADAEQGGTSVREWSWRRRDGEPVPVQVVATRRPSLPDGTPAGFLFVATDVTQQRASERLQDEFIGLVSHELRTPLTSILGYLELIRMSPEPLTDAQRGDLDVIDRNAQRLLRLVNDLLLSVQFSAGALRLQPESMDLAELARQSAATIAPTADSAGVRVLVETPVAVPLYADPERLLHVVDNLLGNAVKVTPRGGLVTLRAYQQDTGEDSHVAVLEVSDTGIGIGPAELDRLAEPFFRTRTAQDQRIRGIGLGLRLAYAIVGAHNGHLEVASVLGSGTTFTVTLPDQPKQPDSDHPADSAGPVDSAEPDDPAAG